MFLDIFGKPKMKPATAINSNAWYHVTEGQVDKAGRKFTSMLQVDESTGGLSVLPVTSPPFYWQFQAVAASDGRYVVRNSRDGAAKQLSACRNRTEPADGQTGLCMAAANGADDAQVWQLDQWGADMVRDGLRFINAANGTRFWLDVHKGNPPFMNSNVTAADSSAADDDEPESEPSQRWYMTSAQAVNAIEYSTIQTMISTSAASTSAASTTAARATTTATVPPVAGSDSAHHRLSTGAEAGIGVGAGLAGIALTAVIGLLLWRRRKRQTAAAAAPASIPSPPGTPNTNKPLPPVGAESKVYELSSEPFDDGSYGSYSSYQAHELPTPTGPPPSHMAREIQAQQRYELDSTPVPRPPPCIREIGSGWEVEGEMGSQFDRRGAFLNQDRKHTLHRSLGLWNTC
ncbi:hypothetical protein CCM_02773 [Cordyceps militaris CM01]|uniref:Uncharacterized protein n=1 Tax=Cordyceps militaris (strain CM01) TaxID=983644 RepID=G3JBS9_CORMM|nr:uncharacterized protein CCM_02773 [Cordyceps militaris CM01]EGX94502.1 hypothetical protein CCM_02773 [Cordyceps militaris CM01]